MELKEGYKQTELGVIPRDWEVKSLGELCSYQNGTSLEKYFNNQDGYLVISIGNYSATGRFVETGNFIDRIHFKGLSKFVLNKNDLTMLLNDKTSVGTIIGRVLLIEADDKYIFNQRTMRVTTKNQIVPRFLYYQINGERTHQDIITAAKPGTQIYVNTDDVIGLNIPLPPTKAEQTAIATALSDADTLIQSLEKLIAKKRNIKQGTMQELLKPKEGWVVKELNEIAQSFQLGGNYSNNESETSNPLIKMGNLSRGAIDLNKLEFITSDSQPSSRDKLRFGDVLFNTRNTLDLVGKVSIWKNELPVAYFNSNIMRLEFKSSEISSNFFMNYILNTKPLLSQLRGIATGTTSVAAIYTRDLLKIKIPVPTKAEQHAIATILSDMDADIAALETKLEKYKKIKQGMMQELLTGRTRLV